MAYHFLCIQNTCKTGTKDKYNEVDYIQFLNNFKAYKDLFIANSDLNKSLYLIT
ncbi:hypothetical protein [Mycoplasmopsis bovis]|uniref:hypothetical protein n=1 Tax=Mycoplasmopsis bovis TaxID=28903 RepID=UPI003D2DC18E